MLHKKNRKKILYSALAISLTAGSLFFLSSSPLFAQLQLQIPVEELIEIPADQMSKGAGIAVYLAAIYTWLVAAITLLAVIFIMIGGLIWLTAAGSSQKIGQAKKMIMDSLIGLGLALGSFLFLSTLNSGLVNFKNIGVGKIDEVEYQLAFPEEYRPSSEESGSGYDPAESMRAPSGSAPRGKIGSVTAYNNMSCPTPATPTFSAYFTTYNKPPYGAPGAYGNFSCNVAMQCTCPGATDKDDGRDHSQSCPKGKPPNPCRPFSASTPYCQKAGVIAHQALAVDTNCFFKGKYGSKAGPKYDNQKTRRAGLQKCRFKIAGMPGEYIAADTGGAIWGRHMDYFVGANPIGSGLAGVHTVTVLNPQDCLIEQTNASVVPCNGPGSNRYCRGH